jgi:trigger factor
MGQSVKTSTRELGGSRVRVDVEVGPDAVEDELDQTASALGRELKIPGFRKGKVPARVVIQRMGREAVLDEALRRALPGWYEQAIVESRVAPVGEPKLDLSALPSKGSPLEFSIDVAVRPPARLGKYRGLEVGRREADVNPDELDLELEALRETRASLDTVDRPAAQGDFVVLDFTGTVDGEAFEGGEARGYLLELGSGRLVEGFEEQLVGAAAGEERDVRVRFPDDHGSAEVAGNQAVFAVKVKEVKEKRLPELDDDFALEAGGYDSLDELRDVIESRLRELKDAEIEREFREAAVDAAAAEASIDIPPEIVEAKAAEMWSVAARRLRARGVDPARYLELSGKTERELVEEAKPDAERALRRESVLAAIVETEGIEVDDEEMLQALRAAGAEEEEEPSEADLRKLLERAKSSSRDDALREDIAMRKAVDVITAEAKPIPLEQAKAREKIWTPGKREKDEAAPEAEPTGRRGRLWTPGS